ncbi:PREDICTED: protodermal factor 1-like isoform X2 [Lupinus angustifolius]|uniref:protodermal factor 1-like isoform X2 n=1 Tax=Lupinus angustifolius TaxID=3871 RepID=UPI00092E9319|nr:PREDICTED: protodermal factor 1-like isoform X2 [Lupinus angustifolius]
MERERNNPAFLTMFTLLALLSQNLIMPVISTTIKDQKNNYSPKKPHAGSPHTALSNSLCNNRSHKSPPSHHGSGGSYGSTPPSHGTPSHHTPSHGSPSHGSGGSYNPTPSPPSGGNCGSPPQEPATPSIPSPPSDGGGSYNPTPSTPPSDGSYNPTPSTPPGGGSYNPTPAPPSGGNCGSPPQEPTTPSIPSPPLDGGSYNPTPSTPPGGGSYDPTPAPPSDSGSGSYNPTPSPPSGGGSGGSYNPTPSTPPDGGGSYNPTPSTPPSDGGSYNPTPSPPSGSNCGSPPQDSTTPSTPTTPSNPPSGGGGYYNSPPIYGGESPPTPITVSPPSTPIDPGTPSTPPFLPSPSPFTGTCNYWRNHPGIIWGLLGWWGTLGHAFSVSSMPGFGASLTLPQALSNTRTDGVGALYREGTASFLNSLVNNKFPYTTQQVRDRFAASLSSNKAAAAQARLFKMANEGKMKLRV